MILRKKGNGQKYFLGNIFSIIVCCLYYFELINYLYFEFLGIRVNNLGYFIMKESINFQNKDLLEE